MLCTSKSYGGIGGQIGVPNCHFIARHFQTADDLLDLFLDLCDYLSDVTVSP